MQPVFIDLETQSAVDLKEKGARAYLAHPSTRLLCLVWLHDGKYSAWIPVAPRDAPAVFCPVDAERFSMVSYEATVPQELVDLVAAGAVFVAHNAFNFDAPAFEKFTGLKPEWYDTMHAARASGLPGGLDDVSKALGYDGKDEAGQRIMKMLCVAKKKVTVDSERYDYHPCTPVMFRNFIEYNRKDVELLKRVYDSCHGHEEPEVVRVDRAINSRGVYVDRGWTSKLLEIWDGLAARNGDRLSVLTDGRITLANVNSVPQVKAWLEDQGLILKSLDKHSLKHLYEDPADFFAGCEASPELVIEVLKLRQSLTRAMRGKLEKINGFAVDSPDARIRDWSVYHGAHTGRWSSRGLQLHNLARGADFPMEDGKNPETLVQQIVNGPRTIEDVLERIRIAEERHKVSIDADEVLAALVRPAFRAPPGEVLGIVDYAAVEARCVAWLAGEEWLLEAYLQGRDVYCEMGSRIFGRTITKSDKLLRWIAKQIVLGMGYGMSARTFEANCRKFNVDLASAGTSGEICVRLYRETCPRIRALWRNLDETVERAVRKGGCTEHACFGGISFHMYGSDLQCQLPSGRMITYRNARIERMVPGYCKVLGLTPFEKDTVCFTHPRGYTSILYGGKETENVSQGICRDLLAGALCDLEELEYRPVLHVHDEGVCELEAPDRLDGMAQVMSSPPEWADGFPVLVEGFTCSHYVKEAWSDSYKVSYLNGRKV